MFSFKVSNMLFFSFVCHFLRILYSSSVAAGTSRAARSSWDWDPEKGHLLCPFSDSLQWPHSNVICSVMPLSLRTCNAFWPFEDCYLLGFVFAQFFFFFYCLKLPCMMIYEHAFLQTKHPCFTRDLGPLHPSSRRLQSPGPGLQKPWRSNRELKNKNKINK